jgi:hypothetical protein
MSAPLASSRRRFVQSALGLAGLAALTPLTPAEAHPRRIAAAAKAGLDRVGDQIAYQDVVGVADFGLPSRRPRLHLVDLANGRVESLLVAHGIGSDPAHTGWLHRFSNDMTADCTSEGAYVTGDYYVGEHGQAMSLKGLDPSNSNVEARRVVVHQAWYVSPQIVRDYGMLGRSQGCFAVSGDDLPTVLARLGPGRLLIATKL